MRIRRFHVLILPLALWLLVAQALPVLWRMHCVVSDRSVMSWGKAKSCLPPGGTSPVPAVRPYCCEFTHVAAERAEFVKESPLVPSPFIAVPLGQLLVVAPEPLDALQSLFRSRPPPGRTVDHPVLLRRLLI